MLARRQDLGEFEPTQGTIDVQHEDPLIFVRQLWARFLKATPLVNESPGASLGGDFTGVGLLAIEGAISCTPQSRSRLPP